MVSYKTYNAAGNRGDKGMGGGRSVAALYSAGSWDMETQTCGGPRPFENKLIT